MLYGNNVLINTFYQYFTFSHMAVSVKKSRPAMAGKRTRVNCLEGSNAHYYTTIVLTL